MADEVRESASAKGIDSWRQNDDCDFPIDPSEPLEPCSPGQIAGLEPFEKKNVSTFTGVFAGPSESEVAEWLI